MSINKNQVQLAESFKQKAFKAWDFLKDLERQIEEKADLLDAIGVRLIISGSTRASGSMSGFCQKSFSNSALYSLVSELPHMTESLQREIKRRFEADSYRKPSIFSDQALFEKVEQELSELRTKEMQGAIDWVKKAQTPKGYGWTEKNYSVVPATVRLMATPDVSAATERWHWRDRARFDRLRSLELAVYSLAGVALPDSLVADKIYDTWEKEAHSADYSPSGIKSFDFKSRFFSLKAYRKAPDQITFTAEALALLNQKNYYFSKWWESSDGEAQPRLDERQLRAISWLKKCPSVQNGVRSFQDYEKVPHVIRIDATPDISKNHDYNFFLDSEMWENLAALEHALYKLSGAELPEKFLFQSIKETWETEYQSGKREVYKMPRSKRGEVYTEALKYIKTMNFDGRFFSLKAYRSAPDQITFTDEALALINGGIMTESVEVPEVIKKAPEVEPTKTEVSEVTADAETEEATKEVVSKEAIETQKSWLIHRANLRAEAEKKERIRTARNAQEMAISLHAAKAPDSALSVTCSFSEHEGFMVSGDTKDIKDELGRQGLGLSWWARGKVWYIRGSKGKPWTERYAAIVEGLEAICKALNIKLQDDTKLARAA